MNVHFQNNCWLCEPKNRRELIDLIVFCTQVSGKSHGPYVSDWYTSSIRIPSQNKQTDANIVHGVIVKKLDLAIQIKLTWDQHNS